MKYGFLSFGIIFFVWSGFLGRSKGYPLAGWLWGLLGPIGLLIVFGLDRRMVAPDSQESSSEVREDPESLEYIICPHCHKETVSSTPACINCGQLHGD